jgi:hypothetical protein
MLERCAAMSEDAFDVSWFSRRGKKRAKVLFCCATNSVRPERRCTLAGQIATFGMIRTLFQSLHLLDSVGAAFQDGAGLQINLVALLICEVPNIGPLFV